MQSKQLKRERNKNNKHLFIFKTRVGNILSKLGLYFINSQCDKEDIL